MKFKNIFTSQSDLEKIREAAKISKTILKELYNAIEIGKTPRDIDNLAIELCNNYKVKPSFTGVPGMKGDFPAACNVNVNDVALHAIPYNDEDFKSGDIVTIDFGIIYEGFFTDHATTKGLGELTKEEKRLIETTKLAVDAGIKQAVTGNQVGDISNALGTVAAMADLEYIQGFAGHGIGKSIHEEPSVPYDGERHEGPKLEEGMLLCIEIQLSLGTGRLDLDRDGWTLRTKDGSKTAMFEHMVIVKKGKPEVLTRLEN